MQKASKITHMAQHNPYILFFLHISQMNIIKIVWYLFLWEQKHGVASFDQKSAPKMPLGLLRKVKSHNDIEP